MEVLLGAGDEDAWDGRRVPLGASAGGGQEPGETPPDCAHREALEELGCGVELLHAETTFVERRPGSIEKESFDSPAPWLVRVHRRESPAPFKPGLPGGHEVHFIVYRARAEGEPRPVDFPALAWTPLAVLPKLSEGVERSRLPDLGVRLVPGSRLPDDAILFLPETGTEDLLMRVTGSTAPTRGLPRT